MCIGTPYLELARQPGRSFTASGVGLTAATDGKIARLLNIQARQVWVEYLRGETLEHAD
jgi:hypothetical protein